MIEHKEKLIALVIVIVGLLSGVVLVLKRQDLRRAAFDIGKVGEYTVQVKPQDGVENSKKVNIFFQTSAYSNKNVYVSALSLRIAGGNGGSLEIIDEGGVAAGSIEPNSKLSNNGWVFPVNKVHKNKEGETLIDLSAVNPSEEGYSVNFPVLLASFYLRSDGGNYPKLFFISKYTKMMSKKKPVEDILILPGQIVLSD